MQLIFNQAVLRKLERDAESGKLHFSAALTARVAQAMSWGELPEGATGAKMEGELVGGNFVLTPKEAGITMQMDCSFSTIGHFEIIRMETENSRGKGHRNELRFIVRFGGMDVAAKAEAWLVKAGEAKSELRVNYSKQETLPGVEAEDPAAAS
jgi:hypothetical protein